MIEAFNFFVFSFAILFGFEAPIISESTSISINQQEQTITLNYQNLKTFEEFKNKVLPIIDSVNTTSAIHSKITGLTLVSKTQIKTIKNKSISIKIKYLDKKSLLENFKIDLTNSTIFVHPCEEILINNKDTLRNQEMKYEFIKFNSTSNIITIDYKQIQGKNCKDFQNTVDL